MIDRLVSETRKAFKSGPPALQVGVATLLGETVSALAGDLGEQERERSRAREASKGLGKDPQVKPKDEARDLLYSKLLDLVDDLKELARSRSPEVRTAVARALGQFSKKPEVSASALRTLLVPGASNPVATRREAANSLLTLVQAVSGTEPERSSEPGVSTRETKRTRPLFSDNDQIAVVAAVAPVAAQGMTDPDPVVRSTSAAAMSESASALQQVVRGLVELFQRPGSASYTAEFSFPPPEREWSADEEQAVEKGRQFIKEKEQELLKPALLAFTKAGGKGDVSVERALSAAVFDRNPLVRLNARQTLDRLALVRRALRDLRNAVPTRGKKPKDKDKDKKGRRDVRAPAGKELPTGSGRIVLTSGPGDPPPLLRLPPPVQILQKEKDDPDKKDGKKDGKDKDDKEVDTGREALDRMLRNIAREMVRRRFTDPNPRSRRTSLLAIEGLGNAAIPLLPQLIRATKDSDRFVRWTAARALGKLGQPETKLTAAQIKTSLGALGHLLDDEDLDVRIAAAKAIEAFGESAEPAVPALVAHINVGDAEYRIAVIRAVESVGNAARSALPAIARELKQVDPRLRTEAARALGRFGPLARAYVPELEKLSNDPDSDVRRAASAAIINIVEE
jgi:HEAT repeat protein